jgi:hypothetical protein
MIYTVNLGVALARPPVVHEWRRYEIEATSWNDARLIAGQMAACTSVMPLVAWPSGYVGPDLEGYVE